MAHRAQPPVEASDVLALTLVPDADLLSGAPRSSVVTPARRRVHSAAKVASAAPGGLDSGPSDPSAVGR
jgi:hypothetical protein